MDFFVVFAGSRSVQCRTQTLTDPYMEAWRERKPWGVEGWCRWFQVTWPFHPLLGGHQQPLSSGHLSIPKRSPAEFARLLIFLMIRWLGGTEKKMTSQIPTGKKSPSGSWQLVFSLLEQFRADVYQMFTRGKPIMFRVFTLPRTFPSGAATVDAKKPAARPAVRCTRGLVSVAWGLGILEVLLVFF